MQLDDNYIYANSQLEELLYNGGLLIKAALIVLCCACIYLLAYGMVKKAKRHWDSSFFCALCAAVLIWAGFALLREFILTPIGVDKTLRMLSNIGIVIVPSVLCIHVRKQVSHKEQHVLSSAMLFIPASVFILVIFRDLLLPRYLRFIPLIDQTHWFMFAFYAYVIIVLSRVYLLCFNVFYQMPKHMRRSTRYMLISITSYSLLIALDFMWRNSLHTFVPKSATLDMLLPVAAPIALFVLLYPLHIAMHLMPADDVIVTSREFVMSGLSTTILVLGKRRQILDWNRKDWDDGYPLPKPLYKEPIDVYRKRIVDQSPFRVSPHDSNIITAVIDDEEIHFLMHMREVQNSKKRFGYVLEISEITRVYTMLRLFEEIAHFDTLTKLHNRNAYLHYVQEAIVEENLPLLIFVGDVNGLKPLNDNYGHLLGDQLLKTVADIIKQAAPKDAFTARVGGDEYVMIVPRASEEMADKFAKDIIDLCSATHHEVFGSPSISWGYAVMTSTDQSYNEIFEKADSMMYAYKKGRNQFSSSGLLPEQGDQEIDAPL